MLLAPARELWLPQALRRRPRRPDHAELAKLPCRAAEAHRVAARPEGKLFSFKHHAEILSSLTSRFQEGFPFLTVELEGTSARRRARAGSSGGNRRERNLTVESTSRCPTSTTARRQEKWSRAIRPAVAALLPPIRGFVRRREPLDANGTGASTASPTTPRLVRRTRCRRGGPTCAIPFFKGSVLVRFRPRTAIFPALRPSWARRRPRSSSMRGARTIDIQRGHTQRNSS